MAILPDFNTATRPHWGGEQANIDIHLEEYKNKIDGSFDFHSLFRANNFAEKVALNGTNTYRWDRIGSAEAMGRQAGEELESQRLVNEKVTTVIDTAIYSRHNFDRQDDWTSPNFTDKVSDEQGKALAKAYDQAGITKLLHATEWKAPPALKKTGAFYDGYNVTMEGFSAETDEAKQADMILRQIDLMIEEMINRDQENDLGELQILIAPRWFNILKHHPKLFNVLYNGNEGINQFAQRRLAMVNGIKVMETNRLNFQPVTKANPYRDEFVRTADQAKTGLVLFNPNYTLLEIDVKGITVDSWEEKKEWGRILETYMYNKFEVKRGDLCFGLRTD